MPCSSSPAWRRSNRNRLLQMHVYEGISPAALQSENKRELKSQGLQSCKDQQHLITLIHLIQHSMHQLQKCQRQTPCKFVQAFLKESSGRELCPGTSFETLGKQRLKGLYKWEQLQMILVISCLKYGVTGVFHTQAVKLLNGKQSKRHHRTHQYFLLFPFDPRANNPPSTGKPSSTRWKMHASMTPSKADFDPLPMLSCLMSQWKRSVSFHANFLLQNLKTTGKVLKLDN